VNYTYDELNRLIQKSLPDSTKVKYTYDKRSLLVKEEANFSAVGGSGGGGGGAKLEYTNSSGQDKKNPFGIADGLSQNTSLLLDKLAEGNSSSLNSKPEEEYQTE
jgi:YD repeat-containing protein